MVDDICDVYNCIICNYVTSIRKDYRRHLGTSKHIRNVEADVDIETQMFACEACKYVTTNRKDYKRHMVTTKHIKNTDFTPVPEPQKFVCETCVYACCNCICLCTCLYSNLNGTNKQTITVCPDGSEARFA